MSHEAEPSRQIPNAVEGIHYLTDYYAVLGVERTAEEPAIRSAWRARLMEYHPDRYQGLASEMQSRAAFMTRVLNVANSLLLKPEVRQKYDHMLGEWKGLVSTDGQPLISLKDLFFTTVTPQETQEEIAKAEKQAEQIIGFDHETFEELEAQFLATDNPSPKLRQRYLTGLYRLQSDITVKEDLRKEALGIQISRSDFTPAALSSEVSQFIDERRQEIDQEIDRQHHAALSAKELRALAAPEGVETTDDPASQTALSRLPDKQQALEFYDRIAEEIKGFAGRREEIIEKRLDLNEGEYTEGQSTDMSDRLIVAYELNGERSWFSRRLKGGNSIVEDEPLTEADLALTQTPEGLKQLYERGFSVMVVKHQEGLPLMEEFYRAVNNHFATYLNQQEQGETE